MAVIRFKSALRSCVSAVLSTVDGRDADLRQSFAGSAEKRIRRYARLDGGGSRGGTIVEAAAVARAVR